MAEGTGFEPAVPLRILLFSRQTLSAAQPPLLYRKSQIYYIVPNMYFAVKNDIE